MSETCVLNGIEYSVKNIDGQDVIVVHSCSAVTDVIQVSLETLAKVLEAKSRVSETVKSRGYSRRLRPKKPKRWERKYR